MLRRILAFSFIITLGLHANDYFAPIKRIKTSLPNTGLALTRAVSELVGLYGISKHKKEYEQLPHLIAQARKEDNEQEIKRLLNIKAQHEKRYQTWQKITALISGIAAASNNLTTPRREFRRTYTRGLELVTDSVAHLSQATSLAQATPHRNHIAPRAILSILMLILSLQQNELSGHPANYAERSILNLLYKAASFLHYRLSIGDITPTHLSKFASYAHMGNLALSIDPTTSWSEDKIAEEGTLLAVKKAKDAIEYANDWYSRSPNACAIIETRDGTVIDKGYTLADNESVHALVQQLEEEDGVLSSTALCSAAKHLKLAHALSLKTSSEKAPQQVQEAREALHKALQPRYERALTERMNALEERKDLEHLLAKGERSKVLITKQLEIAPLDLSDLGQWQNERDMIGLQYANRYPIYRDLLKIMLSGSVPTITQCIEETLTIEKNQEVAYYEAQLIGLENILEKIDSEAIRKEYRAKLNALRQKLQTSVDEILQLRANLTTFLTEFITTRVNPLQDWCTKIVVLAVRHGICHT